MTYDLSEHPLLGTRAKSLLEENEDAFIEQVALAADLLGIAESTYTGTKLDAVERWLVLQLNHQLVLFAEHGEFWFAKQVSSSHSRQSITYRDGDLLRLPTAVIGIAVVAGNDGWLDCVSVRRSH